VALTLADLWEQIAVEAGLNILSVTLTVTPDTNTEVINTTELPQYSDDYFNKGWVYVKSADGESPEGEIRFISDFDQETGTITVSPGFSAQLAFGDTVVIWTGVPHHELVEAVKTAIRTTYPHFYRLVQDTSLTIASDTYEYDVPSAIDKVLQVEISDSNDNISYYRQIRDWEVITQVSSSGTETRKLKLYEGHEYSTGYTLRLTGISRLATPSSDAGEVAIPAMYEEALRWYVGMYGARLLALRGARNDPEQIREHLTRLGALREEMANIGLPVMPRLSGRTIQGYDRKGHAMALDI